MEKAYLILQNGMVFPGCRVGAKTEALGELVFTTGVVGYLETLTDPSYSGQIILQTFPLIGNYGVIESDFESGAVHAAGYVAREICADPSNFRSEGKLDDFLKAQGIPGIVGVDTRQLTRILREEGVMNAAISDAPEADMAALCAYKVRNVVPRVSCKEAYTVEAQGEKRFHVVLIDYGAKRNILRSLTSRGCAVTVVPQDTKAEEILALDPDGIMLSNGPGDPTENVFCIEQIRKLIGKRPIFGICLGHQLTALAMGGETVKLKYGHRGANQPVRFHENGRTYITSQNHGYAVVSESLAGVGVEQFTNLNDGTCEGIDYPGRRCFTVQFHPEACSGPRDTNVLFDRFLAMMGGDDRA